MIKIILRLECNGKYIEKRITQRMICMLFDLQYMMDETWKRLKVNNIDKEASEFFKIINYIDAAMHGNRNYKMIKDKFVKCKKKDYMFGKPEWKVINKKNGKTKKH